MKNGRKVKEIAQRKQKLHKQLLASEAANLTAKVCCKRGRIALAVSSLFQIRKDSGKPPNKYELRSFKGKFYVIYVQQFLSSFRKIFLGRIKTDNFHPEWNEPS